MAETAPPDPNKVPSLVPGIRSTSLPSFLRHAPILAFVSAFNATHTRFAALRPIIDASLSRGLVYPWRAFAAFAPENIFSDMIEAVLGAIYVNTGGDLRACDALLRGFGIMIGWIPR